MLNLYTARHYSTDEAFYTGYTKATGIKINRIEGGEDALFERIKAEGANSPADVFLTVDAARLWRAEQAGIFAPLKSAMLDKRIPAALSRCRQQVVRILRARARDRLRSRAKSNPPRWRVTRIWPTPSGKADLRASEQPSLQSVADLQPDQSSRRREGDRNGRAASTANLARPPRGGDTDQLKAVEVGECSIAISNHYYYVRHDALGKT